MLPLQAWLVSTRSWDELVQLSIVRIGIALYAVVMVGAIVVSVLSS